MPHVLSEEVSEFVKQHNLPIQEYVEYFESLMKLADLEPVIRLTLFDYSDDGSRIKICLEGIAPDHLDVDYICHTEDDIVADMFVKFPHITDHVTISLSVS